jgi:hypothetical protein
MVANLARFVAWVRVALKTSLAFSCSLEGRPGQWVVWLRGGRGRETYVPERKRKIMLRGQSQHVIASIRGERFRGGCSVHQGVRKADFGTVDGAVARRLDDGEDVCISRIEHDVIQCILLFPQNQRVFVIAKASVGVRGAHINRIHCRHWARIYVVPRQTLLITVSCQLLALDRNRINPTGCWSWGSIEV